MLRSLPVPNRGWYLSRCTSDEVQAVMWKKSNGALQHQPPGLRAIPWGRPSSRGAGDGASVSPNMVPKGQHTRRLRPRGYIFEHCIYNTHGTYIQKCESSITPSCQPQRWAFFTRQAEFTTKCALIRERMESKESEKLGKWLTEDAMKKTGKWSANAIRKIVSYCKKFPESLIRLEFIHGWIWIYNLITTMYHGCLIEKMFWSQVILSISVLFSSTYISFAWPDLLILLDSGSMMKMSASTMSSQMTKRFWRKRNAPRKRRKLNSMTLGLYNYAHLGWFRI